MGTIIAIVLGAAVLGIIFGSIGRLLVPGRQDISIVMTIVIGFVAALLGGVLAEILGVRETPGVDWIKLAAQTGFAVLGVLGYVRFQAARMSKDADGSQPVAEG